jgi:KDO2-lipid IV(A) lauroyltransferase
MRLGTASPSRRFYRKMSEGEAVPSRKPNAWPLKYRLKHLIEYALLRGLTGVLNVLPYRGALFASFLLSWPAHFIFRFRVAEARRRIREVMGPELSKKEVRRIAWISFRNLGFNVVEMARGNALSVAWINRHIDHSQLSASFEWLEQQDRGLIFATMHMGNWDLAGISIRKLGMPGFFIARRQRNPLTNAYMNRSRQFAGEKVVQSDDPGLVRQVVKKLKAGQVLAILPDVRLNAPGIKMSFLGKEANLAAGLGALATLSKSPVFPAVSIREGWGSLTIHVMDPIFPNPEADRAEETERIMREVLDQFSELVRRHPEQYFWYNKRWVLQPYTNG